MFSEELFYQKLETADLCSFEHKASSGPVIGTSYCCENYTILSPDFAYLEDTNDPDKNLLFLGRVIAEPNMAPTVRK